MSGVNLIDSRQAEHQKYVTLYALGRRPMSRRRMDDASKDLAWIPQRHSYLDVGCGCGQMLDVAEKLGFQVVVGTEIVPDLIDGQRVHYAEAHALPFPDGAFEVVSLFDVIEHLLPGDDELACREMARVASAHIFLTANNNDSTRLTGEQLHINQRPYDEWDLLFRNWFPGAVHRLSDHPISEGWRIDL